jgi:hypothetical protein
MEVYTFKSLQLESCTKIYNDIIHFLHKDSQNDDSLSLFKGKWGVLLYLFYYEQFCDQSQDNATQYLQEFYENIGSNFEQNYNYCTGLTGPFWLLHHLDKHGFVELDIGHISSDFIAGAILQSNFFLADSNFDFLHGSAGICNLLVEFVDRDDVKNHLSFFVQSLFRLSVQTDKGYSFPFFYYHTEPASRPGIDAFSLAHGTCALQIILMKIHRAGIEQNKCEELITHSISFILNHENQERVSGGSMFPAYLDEKLSHSRVSWCYGDMNVAIAFWQCGKYFNNGLWKDKAIEILKYNTQRTSNETSGAIDVCLCHGASGNAAMYMRMWHETNEPIFLECAQNWYKSTEDMLRFSDEADMNGALVFQGKEEQWQYRWDLLDGSAGAGLALMSKALEKPLSWDEFMLLS